MARGKFKTGTLKTAGLRHLKPFERVKDVPPANHQRYREAEITKRKLEEEKEKREKIPPSTQSKGGLSWRIKGQLATRLVVGVR